MTLREISSFIFTGEKPGAHTSQKPLTQTLQEADSDFLQLLRQYVKSLDAFNILLEAYNAATCAFENNGYQCGMQDGARLVVELLDTNNSQHVSSKATTSAAS